MSFDWSEYLNLAQELAGQPIAPPSEEARLRSSISRAYYAAFCVARNHLRDKEGHTVPSGGRVHRYVRDAFKNSADRNRKQIGNYLNRLRIDRNKVDYEDVVPSLRSMTHTALKLTTSVVSAVRGL